MPTSKIIPLGIEKIAGQRTLHGRIRESRSASLGSLDSTFREILVDMAAVGKSAQKQSASQARLPRAPKKHVATAPKKQRLRDVVKHGENHK